MIAIQSTSNGLEDFKVYYFVIKVENLMAHLSTLICNYTPFLLLRAKHTAVDRIWSLHRDF